MGAAVSQQRAIQGKAEAVAMELIKNDLRSGDPKLAALCKRLEPFRQILRGKNVDSAQATTLLRNAFRAARFVPNASASEDEEILRLLNLVADKLGGMAKMYGFKV